MSPCQHLLCSDWVHDFERSDACVVMCGMWHALVSSEWLHELGKHSSLLNAGRKEGEREAERCKHHLHTLGMSSFSSVQTGIERIHLQK